MNDPQIDRYERGAGLLRQSVQGLTREELIARPGPGRWSMHEVVVHLMDSDLIGIDRMKRIIAEDNPTLIGFDENRFVEGLFYHDQPLDDALDVLEAARRMFAVVLRRLPPEAMARIGTHNERGALRLDAMLQGYNDHLDHHLRFIERKRERLRAARPEA